MALSLHQIWLAEWSFEPNLIINPNEKDENLNPSLFGIQICTVVGTFVQYCETDTVQNEPTITAKRLLGTARICTADNIPVESLQNCNSSRTVRTGTERAGSQRCGSHACNPVWRMT